jgi:hypothetical protein
MKTATMTRHAHERIPQRGYQETDVELVMSHGTQTSEGYLLRRRDVAQADRETPKTDLKRLPRLVGTFVVVQDGNVISIMRARRWKEKNLLRKSALAAGRPRDTGRREGRYVRSHSHNRFSIDSSAGRDEGGRQL